jgi:hypothetical protein
MSLRAMTWGMASVRIGAGVSAVASPVSAYASALLVVPRSMPTT